MYEGAAGRPSVAEVSFTSDPEPDDTLSLLGWDTTDVGAVEGAEPEPGSPVMVPVRPRPNASLFAEVGAAEEGDVRFVNDVFVADIAAELAMEPGTVLPTVVRFVLSLSISASVAVELVISFERKEGEEGRFANASAVSARLGESSGDAFGELVSEGGLGEVERTDAEREKYKLLSPV